MGIKFLTRSDVLKAVPMADAIEVVKNAYVRLSSGDAVLPLRIQIPVPDEEGVTLFMPAFLPREQALGMKVVSVFPHNREKNIPTIHALVVVCEATTGCPAAVVEGTTLTALRTGAASGVATDLLARKDARTLAIIGAGVQGRTQLEAVCTVRRIESVRVYDTDPHAAEAFVRDAPRLSSAVPEDIQATSAAEDAVSEADIICTATTSPTPVFEPESVSPGTHINAIGSYTPQVQEIPEKTVLSSRVFVDSRSACLEEAGDLIIPLEKGLISPAHIVGEIGEAAAGRIRGRTSDDEITLFKSVGLAVQDMAVARRALEKADELGLGTDIPME